MNHEWKEVADWPGVGWLATEVLAGFLKLFGTLFVTSWHIVASAPPSPQCNTFAFCQTVGRSPLLSLQNSPSMETLAQYSTNALLNDNNASHGTWSSCSSVSLSSNLCSRHSISVSSVVIGDRIPPEVSDRFFIGSSVESGDPASLFVFVILLLFNPAPLLLSGLTVLPLTHGGKLGCNPLLRLFDGTELPSLWLTGPEEAFRLLLLLWVGMLDIEFLPESESVPEWKKTWYFHLNFVIISNFILHSRINNYLRRHCAFVYCPDCISEEDKGCCGLSLWRMKSGELQGWRQQSGPVTSQWRSERVRWHMVRAALPCFVFLYSVAHHSCQNGKKQAVVHCKEGNWWVTFRNL